jgi:hypothetical protein
MTTQPMFTPSSNSDGGDFAVTPADVLMMAACIAHGPRRLSTPEGRRIASELIDKMLAAANTAGYTQCDILRTLMKREPTTARVAAMIGTACNIAGTVALNEAMASAGL